MNESQLLALFRHTLSLAAAVPPAHSTRAPRSSPATPPPPPASPRPFTRPDAPAGRRSAASWPPCTSHFGAQLAAAEAGAGLILGDRNLTRVRNLIEMPLAPEPVRGHAVSRQGQVGSRLTS